MTVQTADERRRRKLERDRLWRVNNPEQAKEIDRRKNAVRRAKYAAHSEKYKHAAREALATMSPEDLAVRRMMRRESERRRNKGRRQELNRRAYQFELDHPAWYLCKKARHRAKKRGILFTITRDDIQIPETCPVLGIPLKRGLRTVGPESPTLDRILPVKGYVPGNIAVISHKANAIKQNATSEEIMKVALWVRQNGG